MTARNLHGDSRHPSRLASSRLPRKLVAKIDGKLMLGHGLARCLQATAAQATVLCTDSQELADQAAGLGVSSLLTSADCTSGVTALPPWRINC